MFMRFCVRLSGRSLMFLAVGGSTVLVRAVGMFLDFGLS